ncbi:MBL fold metallo-hydrolase [Pseudemcibacter aquimaris]|uniref:MBL fold metallo-hydrolase n=1 Tax=Pseudemcibacter aquimaris TaxID=2857064 RepID=UPI002011C7B3|nr:MBL fold metallo-hydrolase [Pseudemcibacter aquimaris]MCC3862446.1 MBL fold metallo-hydrolase [Pseudemcibacter aquimaris]WDU59125.1 MBL fold metallo-hydrolase [Pseudemcibacter aquimaris]
MEIISPNIRRITANNPMPFTFKGTGTYIIGYGEVAVIDPGPALEDHIDAILSELGSEKISHILVTHNHMDHSPGAKLLSEKTGAKIFGPDTSDQQYSNEKIEEGIDKSFKADVIINDGMIIQGSNWTIEAIHTPGHLSNHYCFAYNQEKALFTGDHVMGWSTTIVSPPDGNMQDYMNSLEMLLGRDDKIYYPTHGWPIEKPHQFVKQLYGHRLRREKEIIRAIEDDANTIKDIVLKIYVTIDERLYPAAARTIYAHLIRLVGLEQVICDGEPSEDTHYKLPK